jgi:hypothetical protein
MAVDDGFDDRRDALLFLLGQLFQTIANFGTGLETDGAVFYHHQFASLSLFIRLPFGAA